MLGLGALVALPVLVAFVAKVEGLVPMSRWPESATLWKAGYAVLLASAGAWLLHRAGRPGAGVTVPVTALVVLLGVAVLTGAVDWLNAPAGMKTGKLMGHSALVCPVAILVMSLPMQVAAILAARRLAPVRPGLAGLAAGLVAGGVAALAYGLACTEGALVFVAVWYSAGMVLSGLAGWAIGRRVLCW
jgi:hypothetical protein